MDSAGPFSAVHRNLCTARKRNEVDDFGTGIGGIEFQEEVMEKQKSN
jgi:hypothetical protein